MTLSHTYVYSWREISRQIMEYANSIVRNREILQMQSVSLVRKLRRKGQFCILAILSLFYITLHLYVSDSRTELVYTNFKSAEPDVSCAITSELPLCGPHTRNLLGKVDVNTTALSWEILNRLHADVRIGGRWKPTNCQSCNHVAIVIPYRDRDEHLRTLLHHLHPIFQRQQLNYGVYVIEQDSASTFNRGMLMNIGYVEALKTDKYSCFVFSDVDLLPEDDRNIYGCPEQPRHLSVSVDTHGYKLFYKELFGGVENFRTEHFRDINGFSNMYFGWGGEDDDLYNRVKHKGFHLIRPPIEIASYTMNRHDSQAKNHSGINILYEWKWRLHADGISTLRYNVTKIQRHPLYTLVSVKIDQALIKKEWSSYKKKDILLKTLKTREFI